MTSAAGPLYEYTFFVPREVLPEFEHWLVQRSNDARREPGVIDIRTFETRDDDSGRAGRTLQLRAQDDHALDELLDDLLPTIEASAREAFGGAVGAVGRALREDQEQDVPPVENPNCLNCGTRLRGQYCGNCGQRARSRLISLWQLLSEAFGDLLEFDSRLWRTLIPLLIRPGQLTRDYLEGRRARYMPPFRMYLVLSVIFFVIAFFDPRDDLSLLFEPEPPPSAEETGEAEDEADDEVEETADEEDEAGRPSEEEVRDGAREAIEGLREQGILADDEAVEALAALDEESEDGEFNFSIDPETGDCSLTGHEDMPEWLQRRLTQDRLEEICERVGADEGKTLGNLVLDNIPVALIVLLPFLALVLKILYPLSRRYFVEHLLFFVHFHAFFFLILTLQILFARLADLLRIPEPISILVLVAASFYIPVYLYKAMRSVYGQGHFFTFTKYVVLAVAYSTGAALTMMGAVLFALVSV